LLLHSEGHIIILATIICWHHNPLQNAFHLPLTTTLCFLCFRRDPSHCTWSSVSALRIFIIFDHNAVFRLATTCVRTVRTSSLGATCCPALLTSLPTPSSRNQVSPIAIKSPGGKEAHFNLRRTQFHPFVTFQPPPLTSRRRPAARSTLAISVSRLWALLTKNIKSLVAVAPESVLDARTSSVC
jgi:hypothetical protein